MKSRAFESDSLLHSVKLFQLSACNLLQNDWIDFIFFTQGVNIVMEKNFSCQNATF